MDRCGIDLVLRAIAVDGGAGRLGYDGGRAVAERPPDQPVDEWVLERLQRRAPVPCLVDQPIGIVPARVRYGQQYGQVPARRVDDGRRQRDQMQLSQNRTDREWLQRSGR